MTRDQQSISDAEMERRVIYSLLLPAVRLARVFGVPVKELGKLLQMAYFQELRADGLTLQETSEHMEVSMRSAARLSKQLKQNFFRPEREHELPRRIEFMLWYEPLSLVRIQRGLPEVDEAEVEDAVSQLLSEGRIALNPGRTETYSVARGESRIVRDRWTARIGALNSLSANLTAAVYGRFFKGAAEAFARNLHFRIKRSDLPKLKAIYEEGVFGPLRELEAESRGEPDGLDLNLSLFWAQYQSVPSTKEQLNDDDNDDDSDQE